MIITGPSDTLEVDRGSIVVVRDARWTLLPTEQGASGRLSRVGEDVFTPRAGSTRGEYQCSD